MYCKLTEALGSVGFPTLAELPEPFIAVGGLLSLSGGVLSIPSTAMYT